MATVNSRRFVNPRKEALVAISINYDRAANVIYTKAEGVIKLADIIAYFSYGYTLATAS